MLYEEQYGDEAHNSAHFHHIILFLLAINFPDRAVLVTDNVHALLKDTPADAVHREDALLMAGVTVSPPGGRWVADVGSWGPEQQSPATPRCTPCWVPEAAGGANPLAGCLVLLACHQWKHQ